MIKKCKILAQNTGKIEKKGVKNDDFRDSPERLVPSRIPVWQREIILEIEKSGFDGSGILVWDVEKSLQLDGNEVLQNLDFGRLLSEYCLEELQDRPGFLFSREKTCLHMTLFLSTSILSF